MRKLFVIASLCVLCLSAGAQEIANIGKPIKVISPEINGTTVTFRLEAPDAVSVQVNGTMNDEFTIGRNQAACKPVDMVKNSEGIWEYTCECEPNFYNYVFLVDGIATCDPANPYRQRDGYDWLSAFIVDGDYSANYREAAHRGNVHRVWYDSPTMESNRRLVVYTPYGYEENPDKRYPVLYLMHGGMRDEDQWMDLGLVRQILDNRIEKGESEPMIVVMPNYRPTLSAAEHIEVPGYTFSRRNNIEFDYADFVPSFINDVIPYVDSHFRTIPDKAHRAIGGFSMGGATTFTSVLTHPEYFDYVFTVGAGSADNPQAVAQWENLKKVGYKLIYISAGETDMARGGAETVDKMLDRLGIEHKFSLTPGSHAWYNCRHHLNAVVPMLFK